MRTLRLFGLKGRGTSRPTATAGGSAPGFAGWRVPTGKFTARHLYKERFANLIGWVEFNFNVNISLRYRYVYIETAKVACSTIKSRLFALECEGFSVDQHPPDPHPPPVQSPMVKPYQLPRELVEEALFGPSFYRFSFVREPFERVLSGYLDKIVGKEMQLVRLLEAHGLPSNYEPSFTEFLQRISTSDPARLDKHWRQQTALLFLPHISYDLIGRFETFEDDWRKVETAVSRSGGALGSAVEDRSHATSSRKRLHEYFGPVESDLVRQIYRDDFETFGYPTHLAT